MRDRLKPSATGANSKVIPTVKIPLYEGGTRNRLGDVIAYAEVDPGDFPELIRYRWHLNPNGYAGRTSLRPPMDACPECGWPPSPGTYAPNSIAAHRSKTHGVTRGHLEKRKTIQMHRAILGLEPGDPREGDHINRNRLDDRRVNLRITPGKLQAQNQTGLAVFNGKPVESRYRGVYKVKKQGRWTGRWKAMVAGNYLGCFVAEEAAAAAAAEYRLRTMPYATD
jgi:hypothetical protein